MSRFLTITFLLLLTVSAHCQDLREQQDRKARLEREISILDTQIKENSSKSSDALTKLNILNRKVSTRESLVHESDIKLLAIDHRINAKKTEIAQLQSRIDTMSMYYTKLVRSAYKNRDPRIWYMYLLSGDGIGQMVRRYTYLKNLSGQMNSQAVKILQARSELEREETELLSLRAKEQQERNQRSAELRRLESDRRQAQSLVNALKRNRSKYQQQLAVKRRQVDALNREINRLISSQVKGGAKKAPADIKLSGEFAANMGKLPWPVEGVVVQGFGQHYHPVYKSVRLPFSNGIDIAVAGGSPVTAVFDGVVRQVIVMPGYSKCVLVQHGEYFSFYCKLKTTEVKAGDTIKTGRKLGSVDTIGGETQLHFQLWKGKTPQNPEDWLR